MKDGFQATSRARETRGRVWAVTRGTRGMTALASAQRRGKRPSRACGKALATNKIRFDPRLLFARCANIWCHRRASGAVEVIADSALGASRRFHSIFASRAVEVAPLSNAFCARGAVCVLEGRERCRINALSRPRACARLACIVAGLASAHAVSILPCSTCADAPCGIEDRRDRRWA